MWPLWVALILVVALLALLLCLGAWRSPPPGQRQVSAHKHFEVLKNLPALPVIAHRGGSWMGPANTMHTYRRAVNEANIRAHVLEVDLHLSLDKHLVLMHDRTVESTTDGFGDIRAMTLEQIKQLDAGYHWSPDKGRTFPLRGTGLQVPTLEEVLDEFTQVEGLVFFLDFKDPAAISPAMKMIQERGLTHRVVVGAVGPGANKALLRARDPEMPIAVDVRTMFEFLLLYLVKLDWLHPLPHDICGLAATKQTEFALTRNVIQAMKRRGCIVAVFGPETNTEEQQRKYLDFGVDWIVTDRPDLLAKVLRERQFQRKSAKSGVDIGADASTASLADEE